MRLNRQIKKIGVLTSGGDASGMNAAIRAVVRAAGAHAVEAVGVMRGYDGLLQEEFRTLSPMDVSGIGGLGGTVLHTSRSNVFRTWEGVKKAADICRNHGIEGLVTIGGDGTFRGARDLSQEGIPCIGIPATIDNDIACSSYAIGFDTAMNVACAQTDKIRDTVYSHERCFIVEVMGRACGDLALHVGAACGATAVLVPELLFEMDDLANRVLASRARRKHSQIIVVAEGVTETKTQGAVSVSEMAKCIEQKTGIHTRWGVLGFIQRGGTPTVKDRVTGGCMGCRAVGLLLENNGGRVVAMRGDNIIDLPIEEALQMKKAFNMELYEMLNLISM